MTIKKLFILALVVCAFAACNKDEDLIYSEDEPVESYVYRERDPNYPLILSRAREWTATRATELKFDAILGRSFKLDYFPFENMLNIGAPVVNLKKLETDKPGWATKIPLRQSTSTAFSYSTFERYEEKSTITEKVSSGFELNLGLFKIGNKKTYYEHFASSLIQDSKSVFGQLDIEINDAAYNLALNSNKLNQIKCHYLDKDFLDDLYNLHPYEFSSFYSPFVITNFITGGRATALFAGITKSEATAEAREQTMDSQISASFTFKKDEVGSISLGFGNGFTNGSSSTKTFTQLDATLVTSGGSYGFGAFSTPKSIDNMDIDLTGWANSLNNADNHTMVDILDNGLMPLLGFFKEANLTIQYEKCLAGKDLPSKKFVEPKLVHVCLMNYPAGVILSDICLITRFYDAIVIRKDVIPILNPQEAKKEIDDIFHVLCDKYKVKAEVQYAILNNNFNSRFAIADCISNGSFVKGIFLESNMKKYQDTSSEMLYLLYNENGKKVGYTIYMGRDGYLLDTYGMREWVNALPNTTVDDNELLNYTLIAL